MNALINSHPILTLLIYVLFCIAIGIAVFFSYSSVRKKIQIKQNMKRRQNRDKSR